MRTTPLLGGRVESDGTEDLSFLEQSMSLGSLFQRKRTSNRGTQFAFCCGLYEKLETCVNQIRALQKYGNVKPCQRLALLHETTRSNGLTWPPRRSIKDVAAECRKALKVLLEDIAADGFEHDINSSPTGSLEDELGPVLPGVVDRFIGSEAKDERELFLRAGRA